MNNEKLPSFIPYYGGLHNTIHEMSVAGDTKAKIGLGQILVLGILASVYLTFATTLAIVCATGIETVSVKKLVMGVVFPVGLIAILIGGAELYTGNAMVPSVAGMTGRTGWNRVAYNWVGSYTGNFLGGIFGAIFIIYLTNILGDPFLMTVKKVAFKKVSNPWMTNFWRGLACVWLVDLAVYLAGRVKEPAAKFFLIWFPTMTFFAIGFEHSIVNMFIIPAGIMAGAPITWGQFLWNNLVPVTLGNTVAGLFTVGMAYWYTAGMPVLKKAVEPGSQYVPYAHEDYVHGDNAYLAKTFITGAVLTLVFTALMPGVAALVTYGVLEGAPAMATSVKEHLAPQGLVKGLMVCAYFTAVAFVASVSLRK
ncbi:MAG TPA: formate/nitrite transporter family protein [Deltaproteobacteria bacterium]|nr:formate/nitrite transporter family protein [Deltaproteobacteria bacterium]